MRGAHGNQQRAPACPRADACSQLALPPTGEHLKACRAATGSATQPGQSQGLHSCQDYRLQSGFGSGECARLESTFGMYALCNALLMLDEKVFVSWALTLLCAYYSSPAFFLSAFLYLSITLSLYLLSLSLSLPLSLQFLHLLSFFLLFPPCILFAACYSRAPSFFVLPFIDPCCRHSACCLNLKVSHKVLLQ
jgi:hypothetical protein